MRQASDDWHDAERVRIREQNRPDPIRLGTPKAAELIVFAVVVTILAFLAFLAFGPG